MTISAAVLHPPTGVSVEQTSPADLTLSRAKAAGLRQIPGARPLHRGSMSSIRPSAPAMVRARSYDLFGVGPILVVNMQVPGPDPVSGESLRTRFGLTRQDGRIARLIARGRRNATIARELFISPHAARGHTGKCLRQIASRFRTQVESRFMSNLNDAINKVRAEEVKALKDGGYEPVLTRAKWLLVKRPVNLTRKQEPRLAELLKYNLRSVRAYLLKEGFQFLWEYISPYWAGVFLDRWCTRTMRSRLEPMKKVARSLRTHRALILNWFRARGTISSAAVEGFNSKAKLTMRKAYGLRTARAMELALYHTLGALPEPPATHRFC